MKRVLSNACWRVLCVFAQVEDGAQIIDINVDDGMIDGVAAMTKFLRIAVTEPEVAKVCG